MTKNTKQCRVMAEVQHPVKSIHSYLISNGKQSWNVPQSLVTVSEDEKSMTMPLWLAIKRGIPHEPI